MGEATVLFPFLGNRAYLHGTTLYRHLIEQIPPGASACFRIPKTIRTNCVRVLVEPTSAPTSQPVAAKLNWRLHDATGVVSVIPCDFVHPLRREEYPESLVERIIEIQGAKVALLDSSPFDVVGTAVPMFKALLKSQNLTPAGGQWMFTRMDCEIPTCEFSRMELHLEDARRGLVAKSRIIVDGREFGEFYFSWVAAEIHGDAKGLRNG